MIASTLAATRELPQGLFMETAAGSCWRIDRAVADVWPEQERWLAALARRRTSHPPGDDPAELHAELAALRAALPQRTLLVDLESRLPGEQILLAGALYSQQGLPVVTQLIARSPAEEPALLAALDDIAARCTCLLSFNGKAFAQPQWRRRRQALGLSANHHALVHCDLMHHARRRWKDRLPNCRLATLEEHICGRIRNEGETAASCAAAWEEFEREGCFGSLERVLEHRALDLVTLWQLALWLAHT